MTSDIKQAIASASQHLLRPLVRLLLRNGIAFDDFAEVARGVYAQVARDEFTPEGKRPTDSRVAILTGLTRKEVRRLRDESNAPGALPEWGGAHRATRVLSGWFQDPDFTDQHGEPRELDAKDENNGFPALVRRYSGDMPISAMLAELERVKAVEHVNDNKIRLLNRSYIPDHGDPEGVRMLGTAVHDLLATLEHNLTRDPGERPYFQRVAFNTRVDAKMVPLFRRITNEQGKQFLESLDDWLSAHEVPEQRSGEHNRVGVGVYLFQDEAQSKSDS